MDLLTHSPATELTRDVRVVFRHGLHIRPATELVRLARSFRSSLRISFGGETVDARSLMSVLLLAAHRESVLTFTAQGDDAAEALRKIEELFSHRFGGF